MRPSIAPKSRNAALGLAAFALAAWALSACKPSRPAPTDAELQSVLWVQTADEYRALCVQTFRAASGALPAALARTRESAALEQPSDEDLAAKPPAIVCDVDETLLDNAAYNARLLVAQRGFELASWNDWVREQRARPLPGALEFLRDAAARGIAVFYVTNRGVEVEAETRANLAAAGFPLDTAAGIDTVLTRNDHDQQGSEKTGRRARVAATHRIVMLLGDDLGDFVPRARDADRATRRELTDRFDAYWGERWFMLPNPIYGSWDAALGADKRRALELQRD